MSEFKIALLFGGPSAERGISLNSARSVSDHLDDFEIIPIYYNLEKQPFLIDRKHLYSNTPSDFDFKIAELGKALSEEALVELLQNASITFPVIHGAFGEGGELAAFLEENNIPFIGSSSKSAALAFDKFDAAWTLERAGYFSPPSLLLEKTDGDANLARVESFFQNNQLNRAVLKPARSGSSIGVTEVHSPEGCIDAFEKMHANGLDDRFVLEPFAQGREFTVIVLQTPEGKAVSLLPTEIEITDASQALFDYRLKYLPTRQVAYHMPPRFTEDQVTEIRLQVEKLFSTLDLRDVVRIDGWLLDDGNLWFSDINLASGLEQNSFFFLQASYLGWSHATVLHYILHSACKRRNIEQPKLKIQSDDEKKEPVRVLFGGDSSERQVSLMSGTNVWLKLKKSAKFVPTPYLLDTDGFVWNLPYAATLRHTVEEVGAACHQMLEEGERLENYRLRIMNALSPEPAFETSSLVSPVCMTLEDFLKDQTTVFLAIHGGIGENGELQAALAKARIPFTGSLTACAKLCMDKYETGKALENDGKYGIFVAAKKKLDTRILLNLKEPSLKKVWDSLVEDLKSKTLIVKPLSDGCSSGIVRLANLEDLKKYLILLSEHRSRILPGQLTHVKSPVELPSSIPDFLLFETFVTSDRPLIRGNKLEWERNSGWVEITVGVLGSRGEMRALKPSITIAGGEILSLEEKFQGGTGVNITPPPEPWVSQAAWQKAQVKIEFVAQKLGINGFARIDAFLQIETGDILVIEANSIPGLTPSTVIYHQALAEDPPLSPTAFLEAILDYRNRYRR
jgi:D-alanine--D-alanine ligase